MHRDETSKGLRRRDALAGLATLAVGTPALAPALASAKPLTTTPAVSGERPSDVHPLLVGQKIPDVMALDLDGKAVSLRALAAERHTIFVFFRGGWCPYCTRQMSQLKSIEAPLKQAGWQIVGITAEPLERFQTQASKLDLPYRLLADDQFKVSTAFGLTYKVKPQDIGGPPGIEYWRQLYKVGPEVDPVLPVPAVFAVHPKGLVLHQYVNVDYTVRLSGEVLLTVAKVYGPA
ncbi:MAG: peroxiredoxin-like family protein [Bradymonadia bacterium]